MTAQTCACGSFVSWGSLATEDQKEAWARTHGGCAPRDAEVSSVRIRFASENEAREIERDLRRVHVVGRVGVSLLVKPRMAADVLSDTGAALRDPSVWTRTRAL